MKRSNTTKTFAIAAITAPSGKSLQLCRAATRSLVGSLTCDQRSGPSMRPSASARVVGCDAFWSSRGEQPGSLEQSG